MKAIQKVISFVVFVTLVCYVSSAALGEESVRVENVLKSGEESNLITGLIGGKRASISKYPYLAAVIIRTGLKGSGVILNKKWILTTSKIADSQIPQEVLIRTGSDSAIDKGQTARVDKIFVHPEYTHSWKNDIALMKLKSELKFTKNTKAIKLATKPANKGVKADLAGYGYSTASDVADLTGENKKPAHKTEGLLRATTLKVLPYKDCKSIYGHYTYFADVSFCGQSAAKVGPCTNDEGSPLVVKDQLIGIFSGIPFCQFKTYPSVYTDITKFSDWIAETINKNSSPKEITDLLTDIEYF